MFDKFFKEGKSKDIIIKLITIAVIAAVLLVAFDVLTQDRDSRRQIIDEDGGSEMTLSEILTDIDGVGAVDVMIRQGEDNAISGVIITAEGAGDPVIRDNITRAVAAVYNIPASNVVVFEKRNGGK
ncbi:MAG: hypothetical protein PUG78_04835 [Eubacteriales bacterium]|nr:hypothetical protein [Clostridiales bacterium]MDD7307719.1 hypothetical protein [Eubacteriales bacterium]MDY2934075.1 hypothetical protein [Anaerovoracaceae bacterium]MEE0181755.1 hypothetical protein [Anaerovoracaceae bacterium]